MQLNLIKSNNKYYKLPSKSNIFKKNLLWWNSWTNNFPFYHDLQFLFQIWRSWRADEHEDRSHPEEISFEKRTRNHRTICSRQRWSTHPQKVKMIFITFSHFCIFAFCILESVFKLIKQLCKNLKDKELNRFFIYYYISNISIDQIRFDTIVITTGFNFQSFFQNM